MFTWNKNTKIVTDITTKPVLNAVSILQRDMEKVFRQTEKKAGDIRLVLIENLHSSEEANGISAKEKLADMTIEAETYTLEITEAEIRVVAKGDLGFVYGLLYLSEHYLGIKPFWFWMDQKIEEKEVIEILEGIISSEKPVVRFRGWFFNDEVLMMKWKYNENGVDGWKMALEALLRCGGNMAIPGTDQMSKRNKRLAADMGLWLTHHHAEPLGAELFARAYPGIEANYRQHPEKFEKLWEDAVIEQKDCKVVWNVCFRGQGDSPFWSSDTTGEFNTPEKRGKMISTLIRKQCDVVRKYVKDPIFCTNLYGEIMELYMQGHIDLDDSIIKIRADNGFGRMVSRRQDLHNPRVNAMPDKSDKGTQGIYYHVSFYDLQAANHITMLPNSVAFVDRELSQVIENGGEDFWVINCSNVRPHAYYLDAVRKKWYGRNIQDKEQSQEFAQDYYSGNEAVADCYAGYADAKIAYGEHEDEHAGEQFYTESIRLVANQFILDRSKKVNGLAWFANQDTMGEQVAHYSSLCRSGLEKLEQHFEKCRAVEEALADKDTLSARLLRTTLGLQAGIHYYCAKGVSIFGQAFKAFEEGNLEKAFVLFGKSAECYDLANAQMRAAEYDNWQDFYVNDCMADIKHTAYMVKKVMGIIREMGDNARHDKWYREYCYSEADRDVFLLLVTDNHMTDWEMYQVMKEQVEI